MKRFVDRKLIKNVSRHMCKVQEPPSQTHIQTQGSGKETKKELSQGALINLRLFKLAQEPVVLFEPKRKGNEGETALKADKILFALPPVNGTIYCLKDLFQALNYKVYGMNANAGSPTESVEEMASDYLTRIKTIQPLGPYHLIGYSYGGLVALEIGLQLKKMESEGEEGNQLETLILLDGTYLLPQTFRKGVMAGMAKMLVPDFKDELDPRIRKLSPAEDAVFLVLQIRLYDYAGNLNSLFKELMKIETRAGKVERAVEVLMEPFPHLSLADYTASIKMLMNRFCGGYLYRPKDTFPGQTRVMLIKANPSAYTEKLPEDYGLSEVGIVPEEIHHVDGDHYCFMNEAERLHIPRLINDFLSKKC